MRLWSTGVHSTAGVGMEVEGGLVLGTRCLDRWWRGIYHSILSRDRGRRSLACRGFRRLRMRPRRGLSSLLRSSSKGDGKGMGGKKAVR